MTYVKIMVSFAASILSLTAVSTPALTPSAMNLGRLTAALAAFCADAQLAMRTRLASSEAFRASSMDIHNRKTMKSKERMGVASHAREMW